MSTDTRSSWLRRMVIGIVFALAALMLAQHLRPAPYRAGWDIERLARLPVQEGGRIKPLDTVARTTLMMVGDKQTYRGADGRRHSAAEWYTGLMLDPQAAAGEPVFRIDHPDLVGLLGFHNEERKYFALAEIIPHLEALREQFAKMPQEPRLRSPYERALAKLSNSMAVYDRSQFMQLGGATGIQAVPPQTGDAAAQWRTFAESLLASLQGAPLDPVVESWGELSKAWREQDAAAFNAGAARLEQLYGARAGAGAAKTGFEYFFNTTSPFGYAMELYVLILLVAAFSWMGWGRALSRAAFWLLLLAFGVHTFGLVARIWIQERPPVTNLYSSAIFVSWAAVPLCLYLERRYINGIAAAAAAILGFATLIIAHHLSFSGDTMEMMRAVLDSNFWLATHVPTVTLGYSATFLAGLIAALYILRAAVAGRPDARTERAVGAMVYGAVCFALLFSFVGTVLGGIWADQSWGRFWGWDPKENGALMIVLWNAVILHARWGKVADTLQLMQLAVAGNIITAWSWFGTNMLGVGLHSYGFMDAAFFWLLAFIASQLAIIALGYWRRHR